jgi:antitoxin ParD1/3/4
MSSMNISLPESLKSFVDEQVSQRGFGTSSEYVHELIRRDQERRQFQGLLLEGASSEATQTVTPDYFDNLRDKASKMSKPRN